MKEHIVPKPLEKLIKEARGRFNNNENRMNHIFSNRGISVSTRDYLRDKDNANKLIDILYGDHPFRAQYEFILIDNVVNLLLSNASIKIYNKEDKLLGLLICNDFKFYFKYNEENKYSVHSFEEITDRNLRLKFEKGSSIGALGVSRYLNALKKDSELVKAKLADLA